MPIFIYVTDLMCGASPVAKFAGHANFVLQRDTRATRMCKKLHDLHTERNLSSCTGKEPTILRSNTAICDLCLFMSEKK